MMLKVGVCDVSDSAAGAVVSVVSSGDFDGASSSSPPPQPATRSKEINRNVRTAVRTLISRGILPTF
jgi:hypothetical protein